LILPEVHGPHSTTAHEARDRVRREIAGRLGAAAAKCSIRVHAYSGSAAAAKTEAVPKLPLLLRLRHYGHHTAAGDALKRALDILGSLVLLTMLTPVYLVVGALVKLTSAGPVFFRQTRVGHNGRPFPMLKFRTMYSGADESIHDAYVRRFITAGASNGESDGQPIFKLVNDPRVTSLGRFLRKSSLDELPQFWNVLWGEMSLVGPRPPLPCEVAFYKPWHCRRVIEAKPGMTGLWQVTGRSQTTFDEMVRLDLRYARARSLGTDLRILLATPGAVLSGKGAR
jgi:lipopolysaccharide/colanic/teichoic acid biosynthesis glycosyltransferase